MLCFYFQRLYNIPSFHWTVFVTSLMQAMSACNLALWYISLFHLVGRVFSRLCLHFIWLYLHFIGLCLHFIGLWALSIIIGFVCKINIQGITALQLTTRCTSLCFFCFLRKSVSMFERKLFETIMSDFITDSTVILKMATDGLDREMRSPKTMIC